MMLRWEEMKLREDNNPAIAAFRRCPSQSHPPGRPALDWIGRRRICGTLRNIKLLLVQVVRRVGRPIKSSLWEKRSCIGFNPTTTCNCSKTMTLITRSLSIFCSSQPPSTSLSCLPGHSEPSRQTESLPASVCLGITISGAHRPSLSADPSRDRNWD